MTAARPGQQLLTFDRLLVGISATAYLVALVALLTGGFSMHVFGIRFSVHDLIRPFGLGTASLALAVARSDYRAEQLTSVWHAVERRAMWIAACAAVAAFAIGVR